MSSLEGGTYTRVEDVAVDLAPPQLESVDELINTNGPVPGEETNSFPRKYPLPEYSQEPSRKTIESDFLAAIPEFNGQFPFSPERKPNQSWLKVALLLFMTMATTLSMLPIVGPISIFYVYCCPHSMFRFMKLFGHYWLAWFISMIENLFNFKMVVTGHQGRFKPRSLIIMNHLSHFDWLWFVAYTLRAGRIIDLSVVLKQEIKFVPVIGWAAQVMGFIFLRRNWLTDQEYIRKYITIFNTYDDDFFLLIFPEGADYNPFHLRKSLQFEVKNNHPLKYYTLHPRIKGFQLLAQLMKKRRIDAVYDITMAYTRDVAKTEIDFFMGHIPQEVHYHVRHFGGEEIPDDEVALGLWCEEQWNVKETRLRDLVKNKRFTEDPSDPHEQLNGAVPIRNRAQINSAFCGGMTFTATLTILGFILFFYCGTIWHSIFWVVFFTSLNYLPTNGVDGYIQWCHKKLIKNSKYR